MSKMRQNSKYSVFDLSGLSLKTLKFSDTLGWNAGDVEELGFYIHTLPNFHGPLSHMFANSMIRYKKSDGVQCEPTWFSLI